VRQEDAAVSAPAIVITLLVFLLLGVPVTFMILRDEQRKRREWRPEGAGDWWGKPIRSTMLEPSLTLAGQPSSVILVEERDPRIVRGNRIRPRVDRLRRIAKKRPRVARSEAS
jgi:hypothetical protein